MIAVFPMISNTFFGLQSATAEAHDLMTLNRATRLQRLFKLQFPAAVPSIFTGLRNAAGLAVIGAIVGDFFFQQGSPGIGGLLRNRLPNVLPNDRAAIATAIRIGHPASWEGAIAARNESGGLIDSVTDDEILAAYRLLASTEGVFCEPASAPLPLQRSQVSSLRTSISFSTPAAASSTGGWTSKEAAAWGVGWCAASARGSCCAACARSATWSTKRPCR